LRNLFKVRLSGDRMGSLGHGGAGHFGPQKKEEGLRENKRRYLHRMRPVRDSLQIQGYNRGGEQ
jgi:hypothetical protein